MGGGIQSAPRLAQPLHLGWGQPAVAPGRQRPEAQRPERDPLERLDPVADRLAHPAHLALAPLVDRELELARPDPPHLRRRGAAVVELDPLAQPPQRGLADWRGGGDGAGGVGGPRGGGGGGGGGGARGGGGGGGPGGRRGP